MPAIPLGQKALGSAPRPVWHGSDLCGRPSSFKPCSSGTLRQPEGLAKGADGRVGGIVVEDRNSIAPIATLFLHCGPAAVFRTVGSRVVDPLNGVTRGGPVTHIFDEKHKAASSLVAASPSVADHYPAGAILRVESRGNRVASVNHAGPCSVERMSLCHRPRRAVSPRTSARERSSIEHIVAKRPENSPAFATTNKTSALSTHNGKFRCQGDIDHPASIHPRARKYNDVRA